MGPRSRSECGSAGSLAGPRRQGVALHLQCGRHLFWLGGQNRRAGPARRLDAQPVHSVDACLSEADFDELLCRMGGRWSGSEAREPAPGEPIRCLLFPNPDLGQKMGPFAFRNQQRLQQRLTRSLSQLQLFIDVDNDAMRVIDPNSNTVTASAPLSRVTATPATYELSSWHSNDSSGSWTTAAMTVCVPGMQPLTIGCCPGRHLLWPRNVPVTNRPPAYRVSWADWLTLTEKCGLGRI
jgi:hypothetical protein